MGAMGARTTPKRVHKIEKIYNKKLGKNGKKTEQKSKKVNEVRSLDSRLSTIKVG